MKTLDLRSDSFAHGQMIPVKNSCEGADISPPLRWDPGPEETQSFALIIEDPDAPSGVFDHWVMFNIPADRTELEEGIPQVLLLGHGMKQGVNGFHHIGYRGPCPPAGDDSHRYFFHLYALDNMPAVEEGATKAELKKAMDGHILAEGVLLGMYARQIRTSAIR